MDLEYKIGNVAFVILVIAVITGSLTLLTIGAAVFCYALAEAWG